MNTFITASSTPKKNRRHSHPNTQTMVDEALKVLNRKKCSYRAIKLFIAGRYFVDMRFLLNRIKSYIRESLANGKFIQMTGHGLNGSFRLSAAAKRNPKQFLKKTIRKRNILLPKKKLVRKPTTFLTEPIRRRTSLTRSGAQHSRVKLERSPRPRLAKIGISYSIDSDDENNNLPSTSSEAINRLTKQNYYFKLPHMF